MPQIVTQFLPQDSVSFYLSTAIYFSAMKALLVTLIAGLALTLSSCGFKSAVLPNLDWIVATSLNRSLHLKDKQKTELRKDLKQLFEKRKPQARRVRQDLKNLELKTLDVSALQKQFQGEYWEFVQDFVPILARYMGQLDSQQLQRFKETNNQKNQELEERILKGVSETGKNFDRLVGKLNDQQKQILKENWPVFKQLQERRLRRRKAYQKQLYALMESPDKDRWLKIAGLTFDYNLSRGEKTLVKKSVAAIQSMVAVSDSKQQAYFAKTLKDYGEWIARFEQEDYSFQ